MRWGPGTNRNKSSDPSFHVLFELCLALMVTRQRSCLNIFVHLASEISKVLVSNISVFLLTPESLTNTWNTINLILWLKGDLCGCQWQRHLNTAGQTLEMALWWQKLYIRNPEIAMKEQLKMKPDFAFGSKKTFC